MRSESRVSEATTVSARSSHIMSRHHARSEYAATAKIYWHDQADTDACMAWAQHVKDQLTPFALEGKATYINYIEKPFDGWQEAYYGKNYARLRRVKSKFDPENFFQFPLSIEAY